MIESDFGELVRKGTVGVVSEDIQGRTTKKVCLSCSREFTGVVTACPHDGTVLIPLAKDPLIGSKLADRYHILTLIGHGGMGNVYRAKHELMERDVAIKMLKADLITDSMSVKRFQQEARAACRLKHPNVITLFDFGVSPSGQPYLVMDLLVGVSLADVIKKDGNVGADRTVKIGCQAASALEHAHRAGVIHRDLKPGNIMLIDTDDEKDFVKVVDFGVAKLIGGGEDSESQRLTQTGEVCGSPVYMSPEQCLGQKLGPASDIYSLGVVLYEALTGRLPLLGKTMVDTMQKHITEIPPSFGTVRPDLYIPERLEAVVFKALQKNPGDRHQSMADLERDLELAIPKPGRSTALRTTIQPTESFKMPPIREIKPPAPGPSRVVIIAVAIAAALLAAGGAVAWMTLSKGSGSQTGQKTLVPAPVPPAHAPVQPPSTKPSGHEEGGTPATKHNGPAQTRKKPGAATNATPPKKTGQTQVKVKTTARHPAAASHPPVDPFDQLARSRSFKPE